ncbi:anti-sigma factor [Egicoccus sp. AB-alg6-2]|uniref:anti-sigma factor family protein n=1 Tax=Egicoccus sp. AB-alg6-2 TaxID=3242692 RepID=UPI00359D4929
MVERHVTGDRISAFLDDELAEPAAMAVTRHLADCPACLGELEALRRTRDALRSWAATPAPVVPVGAIARPGVVHQVSRGLRLASAGLLATFALTGLAYLVGEDRGEVVPPADLFLIDHLARTGDGPLPAPYGFNEQ